MNLPCARIRFWSRLAWIAAALVMAGCSDSPGRPAKGPEVIRPDQLLDFNILFKQNCSGCHGPEGKGGAAMALNDPVYLAIVDDDAIRRIASKGVNGTPMTPFAQSAGGMLTEKQIDVLVHGIRAWARPNQLAGVSLPPYATESPGDAQRGAQVFRTFCSSCHGPKGEGQFDRQWILSGVGEQPTTAHDRDSRAARPGCAGLERKRSGPANDRARNFRCCGVACGAATRIPGAAVSQLG